MAYQSNYCPHCGEQIERSEKKYLTSWFCENCKESFKHVDWTPKISLILGSIGILFGFGSYLKTPEKTLALAQNQTVISAANKFQNAKNETFAINSTQQNITAKSNNQENINSQNQTKASFSKQEAAQRSDKENQQNIENEPVYFCGAQTKKGTPCTRKVKSGGRCWQHTGLPAMLPKEKLVSGQ